MHHTWKWSKVHCDSCSAGRLIHIFQTQSYYALLMELCDLATNGDGSTGPVYIYCSSLGWTWFTMHNGSGLVSSGLQPKSTSWSSLTVSVASIWVIFERNCCCSISPQRLFVDCTDFFHPHIPENRIIWQGYHAHQTHTCVYIWYIYIDY